MGFRDKEVRNALAGLKPTSRARSAKALLVEALAVLVPEPTPWMVRDSCQPRIPAPSPWMVRDSCQPRIPAPSPWMVRDSCRPRWPLGGSAALAALPLQRTAVLSRAGFGHTFAHATSAGWPLWPICRSGRSAAAARGGPVLGPI